MAERRKVKKNRKIGHEVQILNELIRIRKILVIQLMNQGLSITAIGKALGITQNEQINKLVCVKYIERKEKRDGKRKRR